jgi:hypothetical protein
MAAEAIFLFDLRAPSRPRIDDDSEGCQENRPPTLIGVGPT